jgi:hypothetical protein
LIHWGTWDGNVTLLSELRRLGWEAPRLRLDFLEIPEPGRYIDTGAPLVIVWSAEQIASLPTTAMIEVGNEPNIGTDRQMTPAAYSDLCRACLDAAGERHVYVGAIATNNPKGFQAALDYLADVIRRLPKEPSYGCTIHRYAMGNSPRVPAPGYASRVAEFLAIRRVVGTRPFAGSETGYQRAPRCSGKGIFHHCKEWSPEEVAQFAVQEFMLWEVFGADFLCWYQLNDGPDPTEKEQTFGIRDTAGHWWPVAQIGNLLATARKTSVRRNLFSF